MSMQFTTTGHQTSNNQAFQVDTSTLSGTTVAVTSSNGQSANFAFDSLEDAESFKSALEQGAQIPTELLTSGTHTLELSTVQAKVVTNIAQQINAAGAGAVSNSEIQGRWSEFAGKMAMNGNVDINALVQAVLRDSYMETTKDLHFYAQKVRFYNELKKAIREETQAARTHLAKFAGMNGEDFIALYTQKEFGTDFSGGEPKIIITELENVPGDLAIEIGDKIIMVPPDVYMEVGFFEALKLIDGVHALDPADTASSCGGGLKTDFVNNLYYFLASEASMGSGRGRDESGEVTAIGLGIATGAGATDVASDIAGRLAAYGIDSSNVDDGRGGSVTLPNGTKVKDNQSDGAINEKDFDLNKASDLIANAIGLNDNESMLRENEFVEEYGELLALLESNMSGEKSNDSLIEVLLVAATLENDGQGTVGTGYTKAEHEAYIQGLEELLNSVGDDAQLANVDLQNMLQKQQQTMQQMSNISKMLHDTAKAMIQNMR